MLTLKHAAGHPVTCHCPRCPYQNKGGRHPKLCQCQGCAYQRDAEYSGRLRKAKRQSIIATEGFPTSAKPVFVRAYWRRQKNYLKRDPALRDLLFGKEK